MEQKQEVEEYKGYEIRPIRRGNLVGLLELYSGKELPDMLRGFYTSLTKAKQQIDEWERTKKPRVSKVNATN